MMRKLKIEKLKQKPYEDVEIANYKQLANKHKTEKIFRKEVLELEDEVKKVRQKKESLEQKVKDIEEKKQAKLKKQELIELLQKKAKIRQEELCKIKKNISESSPLKIKPKYLEMEENYKNSVELPELERTKVELAKKKMHFQPIARDD